MEFDEMVHEARRSAVRRMRREQREARREFERELECQGVDERERERLLTELETRHRKRIRTYEWWFRAGLQRGVPVP